MSNFSYDDFAVLVRKFNPEMLSLESLKSFRIVPLSTAPSMAGAIKGTNLTGIESELNLPREKNGTVVESNVTVQHDSAGYCRLVGHIEAVKPQEGQEGQEGQEVPVTTAKAFVLYRTVTDASNQTPKKEVIAVASLKEGFKIGDVCYPSFTITTVNNYQSVAFNPNAFATVEDLKNINGLDGLHIAFDTDSGDLKLLDKDGNVLDQANLPIKADVIIADGEEGYKYVKTDVKQDIHAAKAWMPSGATAWEDVLHVDYTRQHAALVVEKVSSRVFKSYKPEGTYPISTQTVVIPHVEIDGSTYMLADSTESTCSLFRVNGDAGIPAYYNVHFSENQVTIPNASTTGSALLNVTTSGVDVDVITFENTLHVIGETDNQSERRYRALPTNSGVDPYFFGDIETSGGSSTGGVLGITTDGTNLYTFDEGAQPHAEITSISGEKVRWLDTKNLTDVPNHTLKYGLEAFVWTVKDREAKLNEPFFQQLNNSLLALGFHEGDDIALGTNLAKLSTDLNGVDADDYMHGETKNASGKTNKELREQEVNTQRANAKEELVAWNAQHPALTHSAVDGTRISASGLDVRNGKIEIGNGIPNEGEDNVKRYVIETDIDDSRDGARADKGLQIGVMDSGKGLNVPEPIQKDILTINAEDYISGAPTCLALLKCSKSGDPATVSAGLEGGRITANFDASGAEVDGAFKLTITDTRKNNDFGNVTTTGEGDSVSYKLSAPRIVEIIPVYKSGADAQEAVPAQRSISAIVIDTNANGTQLTIKCSQVIDWAQSIDLDPVNGDGNPVPNGMELYLIVKVY